MNAISRLTEWVQLQYAVHKIKRSGEPYFNHVAAVAEMAKPVVELGYEIGLCHDLLEDTQMTAAQLLRALISFGYSKPDADFITACVLELTDVFTKAAYPELSKTERKEKEAARLASICPAAQTVKYADLIDNIGWVMQYDKAKAGTYLAKKHSLVIAMTNGDARLRQRALTFIEILPARR